MERGQSLFCQKGDSDAVTWQDRKVVHLISTVPVGVTIEKVNRKVKENGVWQNKEFDCPAVVRVYNKHMGGVDLWDQRIGYYKHFKTSPTWYLSLFFHILEKCCLNAYIIEQSTPIHQKRNRTILQFHNELGEQLIGSRSYLRKLGRPSTAVPEEAGFNRDQFHYLVKAESARPFVHKQDAHIVWKCAVCERHMCVDPCFFRYHTMKECQYDDPNKSRAKSERKRAKAGTD